MLRSRYNQILLRFGFWEFKKEREPGNMYELRSYDLKVGVGASERLICPMVLYAVIIMINLLSIYFMFKNLVISQAGS